MTSEQSLINAAEAEAPAEEVTQEAAPAATEEAVEAAPAEAAPAEEATEEAPAASEVNEDVYNEMIPLFKKLNYDEEKARSVLDKITSGADMSELTDDEGLIFGKYKEASAAEEAFKKLESENGRLRREKGLEAPEKYEYNFGDVEDIKDLIPEDYNFEDDPMVKALEPAFKEGNFTQEQVEKIVTNYLKYEASVQPNFEKEMDKLGADADNMIKDVQNFVGRNFTPEEREIAEGLGRTADGVKLLHKMAKMNQAQPVPSEGAAQAPVKSSADLYAEAFAIKSEAGPNFVTNTIAKQRYEKKLDEAVAAEAKGH